MVIVCIDDPVIKSILSEISRPIISYGLSDDADVHAEEVTADAGKMHFKVTIKHSDVVKKDITLNLPGKHYVRNALAAIALADELEIPIEKTIDALKNFKGVGRRFETYKGLTFNAKPFVLVDDYGKYLEAWSAAGGIAVKHEDSNTAQTIHELEKIYVPFIHKP